MYEIKLQTINKSDIAIDEETVLSYDDDELLNQFHFAVKAILDLQTALRERGAKR